MVEEKNNTCKITFFSSRNYDMQFLKEIHDRVYKDKYELNFVQSLLTVDTVQLAAGSIAISAFVNDHLDEPVLKKLHEMNIHVIALRCAGFDKVDQDASKKYGIQVARVPRYSPEAVSEFTVGLIIAAVRKIPQGYVKCRLKNFSLEGQLGFNISGKTVGILGSGLIGSLVGKAMRYGFNANVIFYDAFHNQALIDEGFKYASLDEIYGQADIISVHLPLLPQTENLLNKDAFSKMKKGVVIVNTSRGGLMNVDDVMEYCKNRTIGGIAMDVYPQEQHLYFQDRSDEILADDRFSIIASFPSVIFTAHQAFFSNEALDQIYSVTLNNINTLLYGDAESIKSNIIA